MTTRTDSPTTSIRRLQPSKLKPLALLGDNIDLKSLSLAFDGRKAFNVLEALTGGTVTLSIEGASTITFTFNDRDRQLLLSEEITSRTDVPIDGLWFRLVKFAKQGDNLTLTFEDREVAVLRDYPRDTDLLKGYIARQAVNELSRAEFARWLVEEPARNGELLIGFDCPLLEHAPKSLVQAAITQTATPTPVSPVITRPSPTPGGSLTGAELVQLWQGAAAKYGVPWQILAAINKVETSFGTNQGPSSAGAIGWMQFEPATWAVYGVDADGNGVKDPASPADAIYGAARYLAASGAAKSVTGAVFAYNHSQLYVAEVVSIAESYGYDSSKQAGDQPSSINDTLAKALKSGIGPRDGAGVVVKDTLLTTAVDKSHVFTRGSKQRQGAAAVVYIRQNNWDCLGKLAQEVRWRRFCFAGVVTFASDDDLIKQPAAMTINETSPGVDSIDVEDYDVRKKTGTIVVYCRCSRWQAEPGDVVELTKMGPFSGKWLVSEVSRSIFSTQAEITLMKKTKPLPERRAPEWGSGQTSGTTLTLPTKPTAGGGGQPIVTVAQNATAQITAALLLPYLANGRLVDTSGDIKTTARGQQVTNPNGVKVTLDVLLLQHLLWLLQSLPTPASGAGALPTIELFAICSNHRSHDSMRQHHGGHAMDVAVIQGISVVTDSARSKALVVQLLRLIRSAPDPIKVPELISGGYGNHRDSDCSALSVPAADSYYGQSTMAQHCNHIHVGMLLS